MSHLKRAGTPIVADFQTDALRYKYKRFKVPWGLKYQSRIVHGDLMNREAAAELQAAGEVSLQCLTQGEGGFVSVVRMLLSSLSQSMDEEKEIVWGLARQSMRLKPLGERPTPDRVSNFRTRENRYSNSSFTAMEFWQVKTVKT